MKPSVEMVNTTPQQNDAYVAAAIHRNGANHFDSNQSDGRPTIFHDPGRQHEVNDHIVAALATSQAGPDIYIWSNGLARIYELAKPETGEIARPAGSIILHSINATHLAEIATQKARHYKHDRRSNDYREMDCPKRSAEAIIERGHWPELRVLTGIVESPTLAPDGELLDSQGYHACGIYITNIPSDYESLNAKPSISDAQDAIHQLKEPFTTFPFVGESDQSAAIAAIITALIRRSLPAAPMLAVTAPTPGTGKSLLADLVSKIAINRRSAVLALGSDEAETEKRLYAALLAGDSILTLDNIEQPLRGAVICQILTQSSVRFRPLGGSSVVTVPTCSTILATGNNLDIRGDLRRRVMLIRLDANTERPEQRQFKRDALAYVGERRGALIRAALTVPLAYLAAGSPPIEGLTAYGGFSEWDALVRRPLVWAGLPDPDLEVTRALFAAWRAAYGNEAATVADALSQARASMPRFDGNVDPVYPELRDALHAICGERLEARRAGGWLRRHRNRIVDGLQLLQVENDTHAKVARWAVRTAG